MNTPTVKDELQTTSDQTQKVKILTDANEKVLAKDQKPDKPAKENSKKLNTLIQGPKHSDINLKYYCYYCKQAEHHTTVEEVYRHWKTEHPFQFGIGQVMRPKNYIIELTDETLATLREINLGQQNNNHISNDNETKTLVVCGYHKCNKKFETTQFVDHFVGHFRDNSQAKNAHNRFSKEDLEAFYKRSGVIFENGLVLKKSNLHNTKENDFDRIESMIQPNKNQNSDATKYDNMSEEAKSAELEEQKKLMKKLRLFNLPSGHFNMSSDNDKKIRQIFLNHCKEMQVTVKAEDVKRIYREKPNIFVVEFEEGRVRDEVLEAQNSLAPSKSFTTAPIQIRPYLTDMYERMVSYVQKIGDIFSYCITDDGFLLKRRKNEREQLFLSLGDLKEFLHSEEKIAEKRGKRSYETANAADDQSLKLRRLDKYSLDD